METSIEPAPEQQDCSGAPVTLGEKISSGIANAPVSARGSLLLLTIVLVFAVVTYLGPILKPFLIGVFLFFSMKAVAGQLIRRGLPTGIAYVALFVAAAGVTSLLGLLAYGEIAALNHAWPRYQERIQRVIKDVPLQVSQPAADLFAEVSRNGFQFVFERSVGLIELLTMTFFYLLFLLLGASRLSLRVQRAFPGERGQHILVVTSQIGAGIERFLQVKTIVSFGLGLSSGVLMYLFGLEGWLLWGLVFFAFNYITYVGSIAACVPPIVVAFLDLDSPIMAAVLAALIVLNRFVWIDYVEVKIAGKHLNIDSILLFLWLGYWGWVWGVIGLILAFPMLASLKIVLEHLESTKHWAVLMSEE